MCFIQGTIARPDLVKQYVTVQIANDSRATCDVIDVTESQLTCHPDNIPVGTHAVTVSQSLKPLLKFTLESSNL